MNSRKQTFLIILFFLAISSLWLAPWILNFKGYLFHPEAQFSDVLVSHWPNAQFFRNALHTWKQVPLWNPLILSGAPLVGDPLFGIWYPPNWICYLLPVGIAIHILFLLHLTWAGMGMFYWMRSEGFHWGGALVAGIAFSGMPKLVGHIGLGHLGLVSSVTWTPWLLLVIRRVVFSLSSTARESIKWCALMGLVAGILFVADPRWILPAAGLAILYALRTNHHKALDQSLFSFKSIFCNIAGALIFLGTIAGLAIPMMEFTLQSTRMDLSLEEATQISIPLKALIGLSIPQYGAWPETITFAGIVVLGLAWVGVLGRGKGWLFWFSIGIGSLVLALGNETPIYPSLVKILPWLQILRVPARFSFLCFFSLFALAGIGLDVFIRNDITLENRRWIRLGLIGLCGLLLFMSVGSILILKDVAAEHPLSWLHMIMGALLICGVGFYSLKENVQKGALVALWLIPILLDLFLMNRSLLEARSGEEQFRVQEEIISILDSGFSEYRIFSPSYSMPQHISANQNSQLADGVNPLQMKRYWEFMSEVVGFDPVSYSVTLPPFPDGDPYSAHYRDFDTADLGLLNVGYILSAYPLSMDRLEELGEYHGTYLYRNVDARPRAWMESGQAEGTGEWCEAEIVDWSPNHVLLRTSGEGLLVLSEIMYPGWEAYVDGNKVEIASYKGILRSVSLSAGEHLVAFHYRPLSVKLGAYITCITLIVLVFLWWRR